MWGFIMPIKGIFNQKGNMINDLKELEKQILRINALEVHIKKLLKFEQQFRTYMYETARVEKEPERKNEANKRDQMKGYPKENIEISQKLALCEKKIESLTMKINKLEQLASDRRLTKSDSHTCPLSIEEVRAREERLLNGVERLVTERFAAHINREEKMYERIRVLENKILELLECKNNQTDIQLMDEKSNQPEIEEKKVTRPSYDSTRGTRGDWEEVDIQSFNSNIQMRVLALENNYVLVNEVQAGLLKRVDDLLEKWNHLTQNKTETEGSMMQQEPIFKTLYIDKLYLDKYEQNNNFAQLGIKELSGALNIGATYGRDVVPKEVTEHIKEEIANMKTMKEEMEKQKTDTNPPPDTQTDESSSDLHSSPPEEDTSYTEIFIEEDPSFGEK
jgi:hypothetical protein